MTIEELMKHVRKVLADSHFTAPEIREDAVAAKVVSLVNSCVFDLVELREKGKHSDDCVKAPPGVKSCGDIIHELVQSRDVAQANYEHVAEERDALRKRVDSNPIPLIDRLSNERDAALRNVEEWKTLHATVAAWHTEQRKQLDDLGPKFAAESLAAYERGEAIRELEEIRLRCFALHTRMELDRDAKSARRELESLHKRRKELLAKHAVKHV